MRLAPDSDCQSVIFLPRDNHYYIFLRILQTCVYASHMFSER
jgi:hypothetical protein